MTEELRSMLESYVKVETEDSQGAGTIVRHMGRNTWVLTCAHVVKRAMKRPSVVYREAGKFKSVRATVAHVDLENDLALLRTVSRLPKLKPVDIADEEPGIYERALLMGTHAGLYGTAAEVIITALDGSNGFNAPGPVYQFTGLSVSGMSGGMLCDMDGSLIGVPHLVERADANEVNGIGFAVPLPVVKGFLAEAGLG